MDENAKIRDENENLKSFISEGKNHTKTCYDHQGEKIKTFCKKCKTFNCSTCFGNHQEHFD